MNDEELMSLLEDKIGWRDVFIYDPDVMNDISSLLKEVYNQGKSEGYIEGYEARDKKVKHVDD